ncbi:MAG TPA: hybrid sensor histidine kinase/response regulator [Phycisphaerales bacterium]|nr:hybrid sensor histidine kinase/response regulator [Phycisphaerales bacterium]
MANMDFSSLKTSGQLPDPKTVDSTKIIDQIWQTYLDATTSLLTELEAAALHLENGTDIDENKALIRRILHSIKGDSGMSGLMDIHDLCHQTETFFEEMTDDAAAADMVLKVKDWINAAIKHIINGDTADETTEAAAESKDTSKLTALIIDDDEVCQQRLKMMLDPFFDCTVAGNGLKGFEAYKASRQNKKPFDFVTLDINMPEMNGHQTLEAIRKFEEENAIQGLDGVKVIMLTSEGDSKHIFSAFRQGCEAYVTKSGMGEKLLDEIAKLGLLKVVKVQKDYAID